MKSNSAVTEKKKKEKKQKTYQQYIFYKVIVIIILIVVLLAITIFAIHAGSSGISVWDVIKTIFGAGTKQTNSIVFGIRLPRVVTALIAGMALGMVGCVMQSVLRNPLADASTLGVSQGAAFGATVAIICFGAGAQNTASAANAVNISNPYLVTLCAFIGGAISTLIILGLSRFKKISPQSMILAGVALSALFSGGTTLSQYFADDVEVAAVVFWTFGDLGRTNWIEILIIACVSIAACIYFMFNRWNYNAFESGGQTAKSLGVNVNVVTYVGMAVCSLVASVVVAFVGIISFVGLLAPHIMRRFIGNDYRFLLPTSALTGAVLLLTADTFGRLIVAPIILPIGAITSFLGAPLFLYLLFKGVGKA